MRQSLFMITLNLQNLHVDCGYMCNIILYFICNIHCFYVEYLYLLYRPSLTYCSNYITTNCMSRYLVNFSLISWIQIFCIFDASSQLNFLSKLLAILGVCILCSKDNVSWTESFGSLCITKYKTSDMSKFSIFTSFFFPYFWQPLTAAIPKQNPWKFKYTLFGVINMRYM